MFSQKPLFNGMTPKEVLDLYYQSGQLILFNKPVIRKPRAFARKPSNFGKNRLASLRFLKRRNYSQPIFSDFIGTRPLPAPITFGQKLSPQQEMGIYKNTAYDIHNGLINNSINLKERKEWKLVFGHEKFNDYTIIKIVKYIDGTGDKPNIPPYVGKTGMFNTIEEAYNSYKNKK